jgi:hypothetical protein
MSRGAPGISVPGGKFPSISEQTELPRNPNVCPERGRQPRSATRQRQTIARPSTPKNQNGESYEEKNSPKSDQHMRNPLMLTADFSASGEGKSRTEMN